MKLIVCGTGSSGNCYVLTNGEETLVLEAGLSIKAVQVAIGFKVRSIKGLLVTHEHKDHSRYTFEYEIAGIPRYEPYKEENPPRQCQFGRFNIQCFPLVHNVPCYGFLIQHPEIGRFLYVTDTEYVPFLFKDINAMLIEANYSEKYLDRSAPNYLHVKQGHMDIQTTIDCIKAVAANTTDLRDVILCHLSDDHGDPGEFWAETNAIVPAGCRVTVAGNGLAFDLKDGILF